MISTPVSQNTGWVVPEEQHLRVSSGLHIPVHLHIHRNVHQLLQVTEVSERVIIFLYMHLPTS